MMKRILLIEDNMEVRENTAELLELANYTVFTAENGKVGVELAKKELPDIIICDIMMPVMDGYDTLYILNQDPKTAIIPFVFLTAKSDKKDIRKGMYSGADDYLTKPFEEVELLRVIEARLKKATMLQQTLRTPNSFEELTNNVKSFTNLGDFISDKRVKKYKKKEMIYLEDTFSNFLYQISKGSVKTFKTNDAGKEMVTGLHAKHDFFGYKALITEDLHTDSAIALEETTLSIISKQTFFDLLYKNREVASAFIKLLSADIETKEKELLTIAYESLRKRVAEGLIKYFDKYKKHDQSIDLSREMLANMVGATQESVIRTLSEFKKDGLLQVKGRNIKILKEEELRHYRF